jgi:gamma-glutamylcyclotransferase (GGCT)/AIG2-like uncharacterized protein YtfP
VKRLVVVAIACGVANAAPAEWHIDAPAGWVASEQPADELTRAMPGATSATAIEYRGSGTLAVVGMVVEFDGDAAEAIDAIERATRKAVATETRYESGEVNGRRVVSQDVAIGKSMMYRRRIYAAGSDRRIHFVDASCEGAAETCGAALASLELRVEPAAGTDVGWLIARIAAGVLAISLAAWLAHRFRRR